MHDMASSANGVKFYFRQLRRFPLLTPDKERELALRWRQAGDTAAGQELIASHLRLVVKVAMGYRRCGLPADDLIAEGNIGLIKAVNRFDPDKGVRLSSYAKWWIKAAVQDYILRSWSLVRLGTTGAQRKLFFGLARAKNRIAQQHGDLQTDQAAVIARALGVREREVVEMDGRLGRDVSLNEPLRADDDSAERQDLLVDHDTDQELRLAESQEWKARRQAFDAALPVLTERERRILEARRLADPPASLETLAKAFGISRERARQIEVSAFRKVERAARAELRAMAGGPRARAASQRLAPAMV
jgi:RNA polymerase sigma-32 factor